MMRLSKSKILSYRQCHKRLWLEIHNADKADEEVGQRAFQFGNEVGDVAQKIYTQGGESWLIDRGGGLEKAFKETAELLSASASAPQRLPIFEAGIATDRALAFIDVLLPTNSQSWRMIEVKSSTKVKDSHIDDIAFQVFVAKSIGLKVEQVALAHINNQWVYQGDGNYEGLLQEEDLTEEALAKEGEVQSWIEEAHAIVKGKMPKIETGKHCNTPYECPFLSFCGQQEKQAEYPVAWLPGAKKQELKDKIEKKNFIDIRDVPDELLNAKQRIVKEYTISGKLFFNKEATTSELQKYPLPIYFLDFETINFAVPLWKGTRPYQQVPFQFSLHYFTADKKLCHKEFLDLSGNNPTAQLSQKLIASCGEEGAIFSYNAGFEKMVIKELATDFPKWAEALLSIRERIVDLLPLARNNYYHPAQHGSWSLKNVLPTLSSDNAYAALGVQSGDMAVDAYREAIALETTAARKEELHRDLLAYCKQDTEALVKMWGIFSSGETLG